MYGWNEKPAKAELKHHIGGAREGRVYKIGQYEVTAYDDGDVTYRVPSLQPTEPGRTFPNMEIRDGEMVIPISDLVGEALARLDPADLAKALWSNDDVRDAFIEEMGNRWNSHFTENDRRRILSEVQSAVHSKALDTLADAMMKMEYEADRKAHYRSEIDQINTVLRELGTTVQRDIWEDGKRVGVEDVLLQFQNLELPTKDKSGRHLTGDLAIGGKAWNEAREFWRAEALRHFPMPTDSEPAEG